MNKIIKIPTTTVLTGILIFFFYVCIRPPADGTLEGAHCKLKYILDWHTDPVVWGRHDIAFAMGEPACLPAMPPAPGNRCHGITNQITPAVGMQYSRGGTVPIIESLNSYNRVCKGIQ